MVKKWRNIIIFLGIIFFWDKFIACSLLGFHGKKVGKYKYYGNENFSLAWDRKEVFKNHVRECIEIV